MLMAHSYEWVKIWLVLYIVKPKTWIFFDETKTTEKAKTTKQADGFRIYAHT